MIIPLANVNSDKNVEINNTNYDAYWNWSENTNTCKWIKTLVKNMIDGCFRCCYINVGSLNRPS